MSHPAKPPIGQPAAAHGAVSQFAFCPRCAAPRAGDPANPFRCRGCGFTYFFNTASAVAVFIHDQRGRCLFIRRAREPSRGMLALAGGFTDPGESGEEATRREIREELGIELGPLEFVGAWPNRYHAGGFTVPVLDLFFCAPAASLVLNPHRDEVGAVEWLRPEDVDPAELAFPSMRTALRAFLETGKPKTQNPPPSRG
jgi:NADH pyrophosphatase NudC (nudix superfamily)